MDARIVQRKTGVVEELSSLWGKIEGVDQGTGVNNNLPVCPSPVPGFSLAT